MDDNSLLINTSAPAEQPAEIITDLSHASVLPDTRLKQPKKIVFANGLNWVPIYCANCGADGGLVPEENCNFAFYLCQPCADKYGEIEGTYVEPDAVFWERVKAEQLERYGRLLTADEMVEVLKNGDHPLTKLARDRTNFAKKD